MEKEIKQQLLYHATRIKALSEDREKNVYERMGGIQYHIKQINDILENVKIKK
ncbi:MAG TPA: hypothetical protein VL832_11445 [Puia sp.]|nr:hypothetical protein [Puia sp.]